MKCQIPEISWHNRDPVLSVDFQPKVNGSDKLSRLASGGSDSHVLIWYVTNEDGNARLDLAADLTRHQRAVNCVRWSPSGEYLASCDDESFVFIWHLKPESEAVGIFDRDDISDGDKEIWMTFKTLRGHVEDVYDLSWSHDSNFLISGSVDNTAIVWDVQKAKSSAIIKDHKGFVQGVAWDPLNKFIATLSTDRFMRVFDVQTKKIVQRTNKSTLPVSSSSHLFQKSIRLFHDDTLQTFFRRLCFSPDGTLIVVPSGIAEVEGSSAKAINTTYVYTRYSLKEPAVVLPSPDQFTVAVRFCPLLFELRKSKSEPLIPLPYRMIYAIATKCSVYLYDTQQKLPFGLISNIHYTRLTDLAWSNDGNTLLVSSTDGYCSIVQFTDGELGQIYNEQTIEEIITAKMAKDEPKRKKTKPKRQIGGKKEDDKSPLAETKENIEIKAEVDASVAEQTGSKKDEKSSSDEAKESSESKIEVDTPIADISSLTNLPESIKEKIPVDKIIKSSEIFSPEKRDGSPATPIQVRKFPRTVEAIPSLDDDNSKTPPKVDDLKPCDVTTPKTSAVQHHMISKTPTPIEVRRHPRVLQSQPTGKANDCDEWPKPMTDQSPMDRKILAAENITPKTPRRIELQTISTPKSKKKLLN